MAKVPAARKKEIFERQMAYLDKFMNETDTEDEPYKDLDLEDEFGLENEKENQSLRKALAALKLARKLVIESATPANDDDETTLSLNKRLGDIESRLAALEQRLP